MVVVTPRGAWPTWSPDPQSGYAWEFNGDLYGDLTTDGYRERLPMPSPWVPGSASNIPAASSPTIRPGNNPDDQPYTSGTDASWSGVDLDTGDLARNRYQTDETSPKAVRWAVGQLTYQMPEYVWVKIKIINPDAMLDATGCPFWYVDTFGGDAGGDSGGKDHIWRYYDPNSVQFNGCLAVGKPANREFVKVGDNFQYNVRVYNSGNVDLSNVVITRYPGQRRAIHQFCTGAGQWSQSPDLECGVAAARRSLRSRGHGQASSSGILENNIVT